MQTLFSIVEVSPWMHAVLVGDDAITIIEEENGKVVAYCKPMALQYMQEVALCLSYVLGHTIEESAVLRMLKGVELGMNDGTLVSCKIIEELL